MCVINVEGTILYHIFSDWGLKAHLLVIIPTSPSFNKLLEVIKTQLFTYWTLLVFILVSILVTLSCTIVVRPTTTTPTTTLSCTIVVSILIIALVIQLLDTLVKLFSSIFWGLSAKISQFLDTVHNLLDMTLKVELNANLSGKLLQFIKMFKSRFFCSVPAFAHLLIN